MVLFRSSKSEDTYKQATFHLRIMPVMTEQTGSSYHKFLALPPELRLR